MLSSSPHSGSSTNRRRPPERKCIVTGEVSPRGGLIRFVLDPDGAVTPDLAENLPGRGVWVSAREDMVAAAVARRAFNRAFSADVSAADTLADAVEEGLRRRALAAIGLARRAGAMVAGFDQVAGALKERKAALLITASDASTDGAGKLARMAGEARIVRALTSLQLSGALGRDGVRHAALKKRCEAAGFARDIVRFDAYRQSARAEGKDH
ncbi:MAG: RNA-binding protein [Pseudomonadota bacterium]